MMKSHFAKYAAMSIFASALFATPAVLAMGRSEDPRDQQPHAYGTAADPDIRESDETLSRLVLQKSEPSLDVPASGRLVPASDKKR